MFLKKGQLNTLSSDEVYDIHVATLEVLERTGVVVHEKRALRLLDDAGAIVDLKRETAKIPDYLIQEAITKTPKSFIWHARNPKNSIRIGGTPTKFGPGGTCKNIIDMETGECRSPTEEDAVKMVRLIDALENIHIVYPPTRSPHISASVPERRIFGIKRLAMTVKNSSKCLEGGGIEGLKIASALVGGEEELLKRPFMAGYVDPVSPLTHGKEMVDVILTSAKFGQPIFMTVMAIAGATAPATLAGTLVQQNAEILSGLLIAHLVNPHAPVIYGSVSCIMDMRTTIASVGCPEQGLISAAAAQIARYYGIPCSVGAESDSKVPDAQASYEKALSLTMGVMAGADLMDLFMGSTETYNTTSFEQMIIDDEMAGMALRSVKGIEVTDETLATEVIERVGPGGNYLADKHTLHWFKKKRYNPKLSSRETRNTWEKMGSKDIREKAKEKAIKILAEHEPEPVDKTAWEKIETIVKNIEKKNRSH